MRTRFEAARRGKGVAFALALAGGLFACASSTRPVDPAHVPGTPEPSDRSRQGGELLDVVTGVPGADSAVGATVETFRESKKKQAAESKISAGSITIDCAVKLPDDPTDNPELCRSFQMELVDEKGDEAARFRFGIDARYRFPAKAGKKYRVRPLVGKNWEFSVEPDRELTVGERARVQLRQKQ
jgi:hypothetical protein